MVDVGGKGVTERVGVAEGTVLMAPETLALIRSGDAKKGDVLGTARIAGIMAPTTLSLAPSSCTDEGAVSRFIATAVASISMWPISSVAV